MNSFIVILSMIVVLISLFIVARDKTIIESVKLFLIVSLLTFSIVIPLVTVVVMMK